MATQKCLTASESCRKIQLDIFRVMFHFKLFIKLLFPNPKSSFWICWVVSTGDWETQFASSLKCFPKYEVELYSLTWDVLKSILMPSCNFLFPPKWHGKSKPRYTAKRRDVADCWWFCLLFYESFTYLSAMDTLSLTFREKTVNGRPQRWPNFLPFAGWTNVIVLHNLKRCFHPWIHPN